MLIQAGNWLIDPEEIAAIYRTIATSGNTHTVILKSGCDCGFSENDFEKLNEYLNNNAPKNEQQLYAISEDKKGHYFTFGPTILNECLSQFPQGYIFKMNLEHDNTMIYKAQCTDNALWEWVMV